MSGIDKIIQQIENDTQVVCDDMIAKAENKASEILSVAEKTTADIRRKSDEKCAAKVADIKKRGDSAAELEERRVLLYAKQGIISDMLGIAIDRVKNLPDGDYFALILRMIEKYSLAQDGEIRFGKKDLSRLPGDFISQINGVSNGRLTLSAESAPIDAGFILIYGGIEENCSFDAIFASEDETLKDRAGKLLFGKG